MSSICQRGSINVSETLVAKNAAGLWRAHLTLQGQSRDKTILRLSDHATGFDDPAHPRAVLMTGYTQEKGDSPDGGGNKAFRNNIWNLTIDTGKGNPGACGVEYAVSNVGAMENVTVRSSDGAGVAGISMRRRIPGPGLIRKVLVTGFDYGLDYGDAQYGMTLEEVTLREQRKAGIRVSDNVLSIRKLHDFNKPPAIVGTGSRSALTMLDSDVHGFPFLDWQGTALVRGILWAGTPATFIARWRGKPLPVSDWDVDGECSGPKRLGRPSSDGAHPQNPAPNLILHPETPDFWNPDLADWTPVGSRQPGESDDTAAIQRAIDSGHGTVYFPNNRTYFLSDTLVLRSKVRQILGQGSEISLGAAEKPFSDRGRPRALIRIDPTSAETVFIENVFFNALYPGEVIFEDNSPHTLVIKHCGGWVGSDGSRRSYRSTRQRRAGVFSWRTCFCRAGSLPDSTCGRGNSTRRTGTAMVRVRRCSTTAATSGFSDSKPRVPRRLSQRSTAGGLNCWALTITSRQPKPIRFLPRRFRISWRTRRLACHSSPIISVTATIRCTSARCVATGSCASGKTPSFPPRNGVAGDHSFAVPSYRSLPGAPLCPLPPDP